MRTPVQRSLLHAWACTALLVGLFECAHVPSLVFSAEWAAMPTVAAMSVMGVAILAGALAIGWALCAALRERTRIKAWLALTSWVGAALYLPLLQEPKLASYPPLLALTAAGALAFPWLAEAADQSPPSRRWLALFTAAAGITQLANLYARPGLNPGFHQWLLVLTTGSCLLGFRASLARLSPRPAVAVVLACGVAGGLGFAGSRAEPIFLSYPTLGRTFTPMTRRSGVDPGLAVQPERMSDERAWAVFDERSAMPPRLEPAAVAGRNILYITIDSIRHDWTSLGGADPELTPTLAALARHPNTFDFADAHAPAMGTFQSSSAGLALRHPSTLEVSVGIPDWNGRLPADLELLPDHLRRAGYRTSWIGHDLDGIFERQLLGFQSHFERVALHRHDAFSPEADAEILALASADLEAARDDGRPFFAWVFFVSPHAEYLAHDPTAPASTPRELYEQELRFVDAQLATLLRRVDELGLAEDTIVIVTGDHGEEFSEHGRDQHAQHACEISRHVPLLVRIPGVSGRRVDAPVSTLYTFVWLLRDHSAPIGAFVSSALRESLAPILDVTQGAVLGEHLGMFNMHSALVYEDHAAWFDFQSRRFQVFDRKRDPLELRALGADDEGRLGHLREAMDAYRGLRRAMRRFDLEGGLE